MAKYTSGRQKNLKVGIQSYSENLTSLEVIGKVGIGTTNASANLQVNGSVILGANSSDLINIPGRISSNFHPNGDGLYDIGRAPQIGLGANRWKDANFTGRGTFDSGVEANDIEIGIGAPNLIYSTFGNLELNAQSGRTNIDDIVTISGSLGLGTDNPTSKLWVNGSGYFIGSVTAQTFYVDDTILGVKIDLGQLYVGGISTFFNGPVLIGTGTSTGTDLQNLQVDGNTYISGNLGIGTTNPITKLDVNGDVNIVGFLSTLDINARNVNATGIITAGTVLNIGFGGTIFSSSLDGNIGIGTIDPTSKLTVNGDVSISGIITATDINSSSDIRLKKNIKKFENTIEKIDQINGVSFEWKENDSKSAGVIAQELEKVFPELVINNTEYKKVNYNGLIGVLVESVKELKQEIEYLKKKIK